MSSTDQEMANALVVHRPPSSERQVRGGIIIAAYVITVVAVMTGWLYVLSKALMFGIWRFAELAAYVAWE